jgi:catechol 2,3-dioxygenase-like lactoylglutathione lyase family enzyme
LPDQRPRGYEFVTVDKSGEHGSEVNWTAPSPEAPAHRGRAGAITALIATASMALLGGAGWYASGAYLEGRAKQEAADAWEQSRVCLLGNGLRARTAPSERMRRIALTVRHRAGDDPWPARCAEHTQRLDRALASRTLVQALGPLPALAPLVDGDEPRELFEAVDRIYEELEVASLPRASPGLATVTPAPSPSHAKIHKRDLAPIGRIANLHQIDTSMDVDGGTVLRLLIPEQRPLVCRFNDGPRSERWQSVACQAAPVSLDEAAKVRLADAHRGAPDMIQVRDGAASNGFYDATTGQRLLKPRYFDAQAVVKRDGTSHLLYADLDGDGDSDRVKRFRLMTIEPGQRPRSHRLRLPSTARVRLLSDRLLWWQHETAGDDEHFAPRDGLFMAPIQPSTSKRRLGKATRVGELPPKSRPLAQCASRTTRITAFVSGVNERRYALHFDEQGAAPKPPLQVGHIEGRVSMSCDAGAAIITRRQGDVVSVWRCDEAQCVASQAGPLPAADPGLSEVAPIGDRVALAWAPDGEPLRLRIAAPNELHAAADVIVLDDDLHGGLEPTAMRWITGSGLAILLLQDVGRRVYALRVTGGGKITPVRVAR